MIVKLKFLQIINFPTLNPDKQKVIKDLLTLAV